MPIDRPKYSRILHRYTGKNRRLANVSSQTSQVVRPLLLRNQELHLKSRCVGGCCHCDIGICLLVQSQKGHVATLGVTNVTWSSQAVGLQCLQFIAVSFLFGVVKQLDMNCFELHISCSPQIGTPHSSTRGSRAFQAMLYFSCDNRSATWSNLESVPVL